MKKILLSLLVVILEAKVTIAQYRLDNEDLAKIKKIESLLVSSEIKFYSTIDSIPDLIIQRIIKDEKNFSIADFGKEFNITDVVNSAIPMRGIKLIASVGNNWVISYAHGGFGFHNHISLFTTHNNLLEESWSCVTLQKANDLEIVKKALREKKVVSYKYTDRY